MCVVGHEVWAELFGGPPARAAQAEALHMTADGHLWTVVGVLKDRPIIGSTDDTNIWNRKVLVPETTYDALYSPAHATDRIYVRQDPLAAVRSPLAALRGVIDATLLRRHHGVKNFKIEDKDSHGQEQLVLDVLECPACKGRMKLVAMVTEPRNIVRFLCALGEPTDVPARSPNRGPPYWKSTVVRRKAPGDAA
ncbi:ABC transporter permease [Sorangium sp. So ce1000]|uniref:ABC transporter permease n=1 Tax=Sorangium sp. So ce1000 TaxID=3133325 RepID=UPI003F5FFDB1